MRSNDETLFFNGGEPTLRDDLVDLVEFAKQNGIKRVEIVTNGLRLAYIEYLDKLLKAGVDKFSISMHSHIPGIMNKIARNNNYAAHLFKALDNLKTRNFPILINTVINNYNYDHLVDFLKYLKQFNNIVCVNFLHVNPCENALRNPDVCVQLKTIKEPLSSVSDYCKKNNVNHTIEFIPFCFLEDLKMQICSLDPEPIGGKEDYSYSGDYFKVGSDVQNNTEINRLFEKPNVCIPCKYYKVCPGINKHYALKYGYSELRPVVNNSVSETKLNLMDETMIDLYGILDGYKKAAIIYIKPKQLDKTILFLRSIGLYAVNSDFSYRLDGEVTTRHYGFVNGGSVSLYVSKEIEVAQKLKYLDSFHQFKKKEPQGIQPDVIFYEIASILGYPKCCSDFLANCHDTKKYETLQKQSEFEYDDDTIYKLLAFENSRIIDPVLNNFFKSQPTFINFFVCSYNCANAKKYAENVYVSVKKRSMEMYDRIMSYNNSPFFFYSAFNGVIFDRAEKNDLIKYVNPRIQGNKEIVHAFLSGDSFNVNPSEIRIYSGNRIVFKYSKRHKLDGVFIAPGGMQ